jgi:hypothetical protein
MRIQYTVGCVVALIFTVAGGRVSAQSADKEHVSAARACTDIDFLSGHWNVHGLADGPMDATVRVQLSEGHCYATEFWKLSKSVGGGQGICLMAYSNQQHNWAHLCGGIGNGDRYRFSDGKLLGSELRFVGEDMVDGVTQVLSFSKLLDKQIHELVKESSDGGKTWKTIDDVYWSRTK